ncbi:hypothetical protein, partial [Gordonia rhizosphera]|uniref:hypothetical protein n=1 Tax=Gordonia rhizosphera TaxID=83341 RepID=UPI001C3F36B3
MRAVMREWRRPSGAAHGGRVGSGMGAMTRSRTLVAAVVAVSSVILVGGLATPAGAAPAAPAAEAPAPESPAPAEPAP